VPPDDPLYIRYHDEEWGVPVRDGTALFTLLCLEGQQAGLSWRTVLSRRDAYMELFHGFDPVHVARLTEADVDRLSADVRLIRHRGKIRAIVKNAGALIALEASGTPFATHLWSFVEGETLLGDGNRPHPAAMAAARSMSRDLSGRGFAFVGPTICYAFMQAAGLVMDHDQGCCRRSALLP